MKSVFTVDQALNSIGFGKFQVLLTCVIGLALMCEAVEMMIMGILAPLLECDWKVSPWLQALLTTTIFAFTSISSPFWGYLADTYGRKVIIIFCTAIACYFGILSVFSPIFVWLFILRGILGFGIGGNMQFLTIYSEFLPTNHRGKCITMLTGFWTLGAMYVVIIALIIFPALTWRHLLVFSCVPSFLFLCICAWLPESARFYFTTGQPEQVVKTLERIAKNNNKEMPKGELVDSVEMTTERGSFKELFTPKILRTTLLIWILWFVNFYAYHGVTLLTAVLFNTKVECKVTESLEDSSCSGECMQMTTQDYLNIFYTTFAELGALVIVVFVVDRIGRRISLVVAYSVFTLSVALVSICYSRILTTVFLFLGRGSILAACQVMCIYLPEAYPTTIRAVGVGAAGAVGRVGAIITPFVAQVSSRVSVYLAIGLYAGAGLIAVFSSIMLPVETKGKEMKETSLEIQTQVPSPFIKKKLSLT